MKRKSRQEKKQLEFWVGPAWDGKIETLIKQHVVPDGFYLSEVKRAGKKYTFVYVKEIPR